MLSPAEEQAGRRTQGTEGRAGWWLPRPSSVGKRRSRSAMSYRFACATGPLAAFTGMRAAARRDERKGTGGVPWEGSEQGSRGGRLTVVGTLEYLTKGVKRR